MGENFSNLIDIEKGIISKNLIEKSKVAFFEDFEDKLCSICREYFVYLDIMRTIDCKHIYHINCIDTWFTKNKTCPECRFEI